MNKNENLVLNDEFEDIIRELIVNDKVQEMKKFRQHCDVSCYEHCYFAAYYSYKICKRFNLDYKSATRAAMLHDLFLYDWRVKNGRKGFHAFTHPKLACENASKIFSLSDKEKDIILTHMWPLTVKLPTSKEGFILTFVDKWSAICESFVYLVRTMKRNETLKYAYLILTFVMFRVRGRF